MDALFSAANGDAEALESMVGDPIMAQHVNSQLIDLEKAKNRAPESKLCSCCCPGSSEVAYNKAALQMPHDPYEA